ncbi:hypothetical protein H5410_056817 [Solanum commersonii]|uniref:Uncharacterized protein n=1 Tax=Solanum commersonii TaxID=4109 RepID=A0A9J5WL99_SOLCO|nr:hypothetical protein H5410_056817 [Solanum commersonii]
MYCQLLHLIKLWKLWNLGLTNALLHQSKLCGDGRSSQDPEIIYIPLLNYQKFIDPRHKIGMIIKKLGIALFFLNSIPTLGLLNIQKK